MNVTCPDCRSIFRIDPAKVPLGGVKARCSVCGGVIPVSAPEFVTSVERSATAQIMTSFAIESDVREPTSDSFPPAVAGQVVESDTAMMDEPSGSGFDSDFEAMPEPVAMEEPDESIAPPPAAFTPPPPAAPPAAPFAPLRPPFAPPRPPFASPSAPFSPPRAPSTTPPRPSFAPARPAVSPGSPAQPARPSGPATFVAPAASPIVRARPTPMGSTPPVVPLSAQPRTATPPPPVPPVTAPRPQPLVVAPVVAPAEQRSSDSPLATGISGTPVAGSLRQRTPNPFLANDPGQKAKRLARALVSDMVAYLPQRREEGLKNHTLKHLFREEIKKSYEEYVDQVGRDFAESTTHFQDALNDLLAAGKKIF